MGVIWSVLSTWRTSLVAQVTAVTLCDCDVCLYFSLYTGSRLV
jgi:hypothetical protein